jgi:hypothetical protein
MYSKDKCLLNNIFVREDVKGGSRLFLYGYFLRFFYFELGGSRLFLNVDEIIPECTASYPRINYYRREVSIYDVGWIMFSSPHTEYLY